MMLFTNRKYVVVLVFYLFFLGIFMIFVSTSKILKFKDYEKVLDEEDGSIHTISITSTSTSTSTSPDEIIKIRNRPKNNNDDDARTNFQVTKEYYRKVPKEYYRKAIELATANNMIPNLPPCILKKEFCNFDDVGDFLENSRGTAIIHEPISTVPSSRRIPFDKANDWQYILDQRARLPEDGSMTALMDYNAILLPLYKNKKLTDGTFIQESDLDPVLLDRITGRYHPHFSDEEVEKVKYLAVSRTSNLHSCKPKFKFYFGTMPQDFLGLTLLDEYLAPIDGSDVAINVDKWILGNMTATFHDFQVVAARTKKGVTFKDQLFLFPSGHLGTFIFPLDIRRVPPKEVSSKYEYIPWQTKFKSQTIPFSHEYMYGDGMEVKVQANNEKVLKRQPSIRGDTLFYNHVGIERGKNLHFFEDANAKTFVEFWPHDSHRTSPFNFFVDVNETHPFVHKDQMVNTTIVYGKGRPDIEHVDIVQSHTQEPQFSWKTFHPKHERPKKKYRGTSQIIDFELQGMKVKLGISHSVTEHWPGHVDKRGYLSHFYAFKPEPPFDIVALSGHFCFNHMHEDDVGYGAQWISKRPLENRTAPILLLDRHYRCPIITFASGLTEMIGHEGEYVIVSYGVNDCYTRSVIIPKKKIEMLLMPQQGIV